MDKLFLKLGVGAVVFLSAIGLVQAEEYDATLKEGVSIGRCIAKGNTDFAIFLKSTIFADGFVEGVIEPFGDILKRNQCHANDVSILIKQRDKIKQMIRESFLTCKAERVKDLRKAFFKVSAEIYYVRHIVDGNVIAGLPYGLNTRLLENRPDLFANPLTIEEEIREKYMADNMIPPSEFTSFIRSLHSKYQERKKTYAVCDSGDWKRVSEKWKEFIDGAAGTAEAVSDFDRRVAGRAEKIDQAIASYEDFFGSMFQMNTNNLAPEDALDDFMESVKRDFSSGERESFSQRDLLEAVIRADKGINLADLRNELESKYEIIYANTTNDGMRNFVNELQSMRETLESSFDPVRAIESCSDSINLRQCPGS